MAKNNRNRTAPATTTAPTAPVATETPAPVAPTAPTSAKDPRYIAIVMTPELLTAIRTAADGKPLGGFLRNIVCEKLNVTLTTATRTRGTYAGMTDEQKKAAKTELRKTKAQEAKDALAFYRKMMAEQKAAPTA